MTHFNSCTRVTRHAAAPVEDTVTALSGGVSLCLVTSPTTHQVTTIDSNRCRIALTTFGAFVVYRLITVTKIGRPFVVDQVVCAGRFVVDVNGN